MRSQSGDRVSRVADRLYASQSLSTDKLTVEVPVYLDTGLEALSLEPIIAPSLQRMRPSIRHAETLLPPMPPRSNSVSLQLPPRAAGQDAAAKTALDRDAVVLHSLAGAPSIQITPPTLRRDKSDDSTSSSEPDPFALDRDQLSALVTPMPKRPPLERRAVSYRTQRELPLRVQAVRRSHQEQFAQTLMAASEMRRLTAAASGASPRRQSEADAGRREVTHVRPQGRPGPSPIQRQQRSRSVVPASRPEQRSRSLSRAPESPRSRSSSRTPSYQRHERLPSGPHAAHTPPPRSRHEVVEDFYLLAAMESWSFDS